MTAPSPRRSGRAAATVRRATDGPPSTILQRQTVTTLTLEALRDRILRGVYPEGEPLRQDALAEELGVSRIPVREALRQLDAEGLVTFNPHRGAIVSTLSTAEIQELFELRASIESDLLRRAVPHLTPAQLAHASDVLDAYEDALRSGDVAEYGELNWQFHSTLYAAGERPLTMGIVQKLHHQSDRYSRMQLALTHGENRANDEHRAILQAARARDTARACRQLEAHILGAGRSLHEFLRVHREEKASAAARRSR